MGKGRAEALPRGCDVRLLRTSCARLPVAFYKDARSRTIPPEGARRFPRCHPCNCYSYSRTRHRIAAVSPRHRVTENWVGSPVALVADTQRKETTVSGVAPSVMPTTAFDAVSASRPIASAHPPPKHPECTPPNRDRSSHALPHVSLPSRPACWAGSTPKRSTSSHQAVHGSSYGLKSSSSIRL